MSKFPNNWALHHVPTSVKDSLAWWHRTLSIPNAERTLSPWTIIDLDIYVDASTSWGIVLMVGDRWAAWSLCKGWKVAGQDIGWAESIALELAILWIISQNFLDSEIIIHGDNTSVVSAL